MLKRGSVKCPDLPRSPAEQACLMVRSNPRTVFLGATCASYGARGTRERSRPVTRYRTVLTDAE